MKKDTVILAIESSGRTGSVAVGVADEILGERVFSGPLRHSAELLPATVELLEGIGRDAGDIGQVYISVGPGSFTGLRIAVTAAKMMFLANAAKIVPIDTLDVIAENAVEGEDLGRVAAILDAKRGQFYIAVYEWENERWRKVLADCLLTAEQLKERFTGDGGRIWLLGEGLVYYKDKFVSEGIDFLDEGFWWPKAANVYRLGRKKAHAGEFTDPIELVPKYLRRPEAEEKYA